MEIYFSKTSILSNKAPLVGMGGGGGGGGGGAAYYLQNLL